MSLILPTTARKPVTAMCEVVAEQPDLATPPWWETMMGRISEVVDAPFGGLRANLLEHALKLARALTGRPRIVPPANPVSAPPCV